MVGILEEGFENRKSKEAFRLPERQTQISVRAV
jgi:hypothetical protein